MTTKEYLMCFATVALGVAVGSLLADQARKMLD